MIPDWIVSNIRNSINWKWHVKIPISYFMERYPRESYDTEEAWNKAIADGEKALYKQIDDYLAGEKNVHKAFYSKISVDESGKPLPGWEIIELKSEVKDEAWLRAYGTAAMATTSGMGLSPSIGGQILPNGLGSGSGSDLREQFNFHIQVMTSQPRQTTLEPFYIIKRRNAWPKEIHLGYRDVILESTDKNPTGFTKQNEQAPTSNKSEKKDPMNVSL